jgi:16S rRNA C967 or C1407 C5-methylase (RsmB/RsmF family)/NOL1/NOP2/fmu family ribosome biogenesis protein
LKGKEIKLFMVLPDQFIQRMKKILGNNYNQFLESFNYEPKTSIRINPEKYAGRPNLVPVDYCTTGYYLPERPIFTIDPFLHSGVYYVQEASSMFLEQAIKQTESTEPRRILDLCASPGGKSTHLASLISADSLLVSNEVIRQRAQILSENLKKWGNANVIVTNNDPKDFSRLEGFFDVMVIDAPCSGEGLFRRDERAVAEWSVANTELCSQRQQRILADAWPTLKNGGILIYSTCTFNPGENEENIKWLKEFASVESVPLNIDDCWGITKTDADGIPCYRFYPHKVSGEGLFMTVLRKKGDSKSFSVKRNKDNQLLASKSEKESAQILVNRENIEILRFENSLLAFPINLLPDLFQIKNNLRIIHAGIKIGELKGNDLLPAHELALSPILDTNAFPNIDLSIKDALTFLKRDDILPVSQDKGWHLLSYRKIPIGWAKNLGNRYNSAFPKEWRIRMSISEFQGERLENEMAKFPL